MGKDWRFFKNYIDREREIGRIDREKYVFLLLFAWIMKDYKGFSWPTKSYHTINDNF